ncbi:hypothetical protein [Butyrivibrio sp. MC2013]|uniref:hypothetical protein n=1 Tax=Butyrivibrio sp. MC2013 TaxID=1280686 RepID=UPI000424508E|nr:hypothetical protein [Butyrivibrio sp. MC2013]
MACFLAPTTEAVVTTVITKAVESKEKATGNSSKSIIPLSTKLHWLNRLLAGGSVLLAFEHVWHGEVTPWFPFLTAASNAADTAEMLKELSTVGVSMAALITVVWGVMCVAAEAIVRRSSDNTASEEN